MNPRKYYTFAEAGVVIYPAYVGHLVYPRYGDDIAISPVVVCVVDSCAVDRQALGQALKDYQRHSTDRSATQAP